MSKNILATKYYKHFKFFTDSIVFNKEEPTKSEKQCDKKVDGI